MPSSGPVLLPDRPGIRADIQALRAFAVLAVVLFHIWPDELPGGYIGVDVFFVISGFLITSQLIRARERGTLRLGSFWAARARRLLPASLLVLAVSVVMTVIWAPATLQAQYLRSIIGAALYTVNWQLAADGVDYLAHDNSPPIAQHYWSLAVEEQFYVLWPLLVILATVGVARTAAAKRRTLLIGAISIAVVGFAICLWLTGTSYPFGYFSTPSRLWEFALGAIVAILPPLVAPCWAKSIVWMSAGIVLVASAFLYGDSTPFPGPWALLPTVAVALLIAMGPHAPAPAFDRMVSFRPVQWIGDQSYGIYLWHWPLVIIAPFVLGRTPHLPENVAILVLTVAIAALTKNTVEDPIRFARPVVRLHPGRILIATAVSMILVVGIAVVPMWRGAEAAAQQAEAVAKDLGDPAACRGAAVLLESDCASALEEAISSEDVVPAMAGLADDTVGAFDCYDFDTEKGADLRTCPFGDESKEALRIAVTGDSHGAMLLPGLQEVADARGWAIDSYVGRGCVWREPAVGGCEKHNELLTDRFTTGEYDVELVTAWNTPDLSAEQRADAAESYAAAWKRAADAGTQIVVLADNPNVPQAAQDCVATADELTVATCAFDEEDAHLSADPLREAAKIAGVPIIDLSAAYCTDAECPMMLGGVLVYRDTHHITATFSRTLAPYLADRLDSAIG